jgi:hypothetical protein
MRSYEKAFYTVVFACCVGGTKLPMSLIFKTMPEDTSMLMKNSGWMRMV